MAAKLLLIEYEPRYIDKVRSAAGLDFEVSVARDGDEGVDLFAKARPDVVLLSAILPKSRANDVIREIRRRSGPKVPPILIMMSGYKGSNPKADAQKIGAFDILEKPFSDDTFRSLVFEALDSTDAGARTMKIDLNQVGSLTSSDIFSDVLEDLKAEPAPPPPSPPSETRRPSSLEEITAFAAPGKPAPAPAAKRPTMDTDVHRRLEETLSGVFGEKRSPSGAPTAAASKAVSPSAAPPSASLRPTSAAAPVAARPAPRPQVNSSDLDRMLNDTLSGLGGAKPKMAAPKPEPVRPPTGPIAKSDRAVASDKERFGQFQLMEKIALGGMAEVYKAKMSGVDGFQKIVAIKKILPHMAASEDFITMFADEAKLAAQLNHPNIIHIYDLGKVDNSYYIAMEYVEGRDLRSILNSGAEHGLPLPPELALYVASKLAAALDYAHRRKDFDGRDLSLVHRDVSPQNVLISYEGDIKLCDFGIAKAATKSSQTQIGALKGKLQYMSPEQASGRPVDRRSDLFSLGSVLYEMLVGEKLFGGDTDLTILEQVRNAKAEPPSKKNPELPKKVDSIVLKALAKSQDERYQNASDFQRDLESVLYSFSPTPGSADLAIYLHHLQAEEKAAAADGEKALAGEHSAASASAEPARSKKAKGTVVQRKTTTSVPIPPEARLSSPSVITSAPAPEPPPVVQQSKSGVFGAYSSSRMESEKKGRALLIAGIGVLAAVLVVVVVLMMRRAPTTPAHTVAPAPVSATPSPVPTTSVSSAAAASTTLTEKGVDEEVKRQLAARKKDLEKSQAAAKPADQKSAKVDAGAATSTAPAPVTAAKPAPIPVPAPVPIAVAASSAPSFAPKKIETPAPSDAAAGSPEAPAPVSRGDLVSIGPGVVEPALASPLRVNYPPAARQEQVTGKVIILALIDDNGNVASARIQSGVAPKSGINEAILDAVKRAKFRPATKDGVPVKMYKAIAVEVQP